MSKRQPKKFYLPPDLIRSIELNSAFHSISQSEYVESLLRVGIERSDRFDSLIKNLIDGKDDEKNDL